MEILNQFQTFEEWKRQGKKVKRGEKALFRLPMYRPYRSVEKDEDWNEVEDTEKTRFRLELAYIFASYQVEGGVGNKEQAEKMKETVEKYLEALGLIKVDDTTKRKENMKKYEKTLREKDKEKNKEEVEGVKKEEVKEEEVEDITPEDIEAMEAINKEIAQEMLREENDNGWTMKTADTMQTVCEFHKVELPR